VAGPDIGQVLAAHGRPLGVRAVLHWADNLLDALSYLHSRCIVHHDIKPRNVRLDATGRAVLVDFGLAQHLSADTVEASAGYTAAYAPLEQVRGARTDARSDLYALGATLYELLARCSPPRARARATAVAAGRGDPLLPLERLNPAVPPSVARVVTRALALAPEERFWEASEMQLALHAAGRMSTVWTRRDWAQRARRRPIVPAHAVTVPRAA
jgi:serine/threonine protein kinase